MIVWAIYGVAWFSIVYIVQVLNGYTVDIDKECTFSPTKHWKNDVWLLLYVTTYAWLPRILATQQIEFQRVHAWLFSLTTTCTANSGAYRSSKNKPDGLIPPPRQLSPCTRTSTLSTSNYRIPLDQPMTSGIPCAPRRRLINQPSSASARLSKPPAPFRALVCCTGAGGRGAL